MPKSRVTAVMGRLFCRNYDYPQSFHASLAKSNFHVSVFLIVISAYYFQLFTFNFCVKLFKFLLADSDFHASAFQIPIFKFLLASSNFHASVFRLFIVRFQLSDFCWRFQFSRFCFVNFLRVTNFIFKSELPA